MIVLSAGHYPSKPGACGIGNDTFCEHAIASEWITKIAAHLYDRGTPFEVVPTGRLSAKIKFINAINPLPTLCVELHFNSSVGGKAKGCETLYYPGSETGRIYATALQTAMLEHFGPDRGVKEGWYRMDAPGHVDYPGDVDGDEKVDYLLRKTRCPAVIIEPEFIQQVEGIVSKCDATCKSLAGTLSVLDTIISKRS